MTERQLLHDLPHQSGVRVRASRVLIVVPAYNESRSIAEVIREIRTALPSVSVVVVDDASEDETADVCQRQGVLCLSLPFNLGVGGAMRTGFLYARQHRFDAVVQVDADGQHDPTFVPAMLSELDRGADVVVGSRFAGTGTYETGFPRRLAMSLVSHLVSRTCATELTDATSGFRAAGPRAIDLFSRAYPAEYLGDTVQSLIMAHRTGLVLREVPVEMRARSAGRPSQGAANSIRYLARSGFHMALGTQTRPERLWRNGSAL